MAYIVGKDRNQNRIIDKDNSVRTLYRTCNGRSPNAKIIVNKYHFIRQVT